MGQSPQVTLVDKLLLGAVAVRAVGALFLRMLTRPVAGGAQADTFLKDVVYAAARTGLSVMGVGTEQFINGTTESEYLNLAKAKNFQPDTSVLDGGLKLHWIGNKSAKKMLLFFHGGGYVLAASSGHFLWLYDLQQSLAKDHDFAVVVLSYTLAPHGHYPQQMSEAVQSLKYLLEKESKQPGDIFVAGDSAGGNMTMMLASNVLHPHPDVSQKVTLTQPLAGAILISPWFQFVPTGGRADSNGGSDYVTSAAAKRWTSLFLGPNKPDKYNQVILADAEWFKGLEKVYKDIFVWGGGGEILIDSIEQGTKTLQAAHPRTTIVVQPGVAHEDQIFQVGLGYKKGDGTTVIENWIAKRLGS